MGLGIYTTATPEGVLSQDGSLSAPFSTTIDGRTGGSREFRLYVRNDDTDYSFSGILLKPVDTEGASIVDGTGGFNWKLSAGDTQPTTDEWDEISEGNEIALGDLGTDVLTDISTYLPFWVKVTVPRNASVHMYTDVTLQINATAILL